MKGFMPPLYARARNNAAMACHCCAHFLPSPKADALRPGLPGYGYCKAAPDAVLRARFFHESQPTCWLTPPLFKETAS